jgi:signal transduction histidine kinase
MTPPGSSSVRATLSGAALALGTVAVATGAKAYLIDPVVDVKDPFALYIAAVALTAWWGWPWSGISIALSTVAADYFFVLPVHSLHLHDGADLTLMVLFVAESSLIAWLIARLKAERRIAERAVALRDRFVATMSHDLRNPLQTILAWTHIVLADRLVNPERVGKALQAIQHSVRQQQRLIEDLLDLSVAAQGKLQIDRRRMDLGPLVRAVVEEWIPHCEQHGVILKAEYVLEPVMVEADADRLRQAIENLLSNSVKFTPAGGSIRIQIAPVHDAAIIRVVDSGEGIDPAMLDRIFESWERAGRSTPEGVGLGLAITRHLVTLHHGTITAASVGKGHGTTFEIRLPLAA